MNGDERRPSTIEREQHHADAARERIAFEVIIFPLLWCGSVLRASPARDKIGAT